MSSWTNFYDTAPLAATLARHVDFGALNRSATAFAVTAVDVGTGEIAVFANKPLGKVEAVEITADHVRASGSLPPAFPWAVIEGRPYWDGGIVDNTPLGTAIDGFSADEGVTRLLVVMNLFPLRAELPRNLTGVDDRASELRFGNRVRQDRKTAERINHFVQTIDALVGLVPASAITGQLRSDVDRALAFKLVETIDIDFQNPSGGVGPAQQAAFDDDSGFRDYSAATVRARRERGYAIAEKKLRPFFESHGFLCR
jgi:NTE family protein